MLNMHVPDFLRWRWFEELPANGGAFKWRAVVLSTNAQLFLLTITSRNSNGSEASQCAIKILFPGQKDVPWLQPFFARRQSQARHPQRHPYRRSCEARHRHSCHRRHPVHGNRGATMEVGAASGESVRQTKRRPEPQGRAPCTFANSFPAHTQKRRVVELLVDRTPDGIEGFQVSLLLRRGVWSSAGQKAQ